MRSLTTFLAPLRSAHLLVFGLLMMAAPALAQVDADVIDDQRETIRTIEHDVDDYAKQLEGPDAHDADLVSIRVELERLSREVFESSLAMRPRLSEVNARLEQLGAPRGEGEPPEPEAVAQERIRLQDEKASFNVLIGEAERLSVRINDMMDQIAQMRRDLFTRNLARRYDIAAAFGSDVGKELVSEVQWTYRTFSSWVRFITTYKLKSLLLAAALSLLVALPLHLGGRRLFERFIEPDPEVEAPTYLSRLSVALFSTLIPSIALAVFLACGYYFLDYFALFRPAIGEIVWSFFTFIAVVFFVYRLSHAILLPHMANWRLLPVRSQAARWLLLLSTLTATVVGFDYFVDRAYQMMGSQLSLTVASSFIATVIVGLLVVLIGTVKPLADEEGRPRPWPAMFRYPVLFLGAAIIVSALLGYVGFARFLSLQVVVNGAILATMYIGILTASAVTSEGALANSWLAQRLQRYSAFDETTFDQIGLVAGIAINAMVILIGVPLILLQWGFQWADLVGWTYRAAGPIRVGSLSFSLGGILTGILVFVLGYFFTRWFQSWLDGKVLARSRVDSGVRNSIRTAAGYAGIAIAALIGVSAAGINLSNLALVAGALSLGIGFGLQNIVSNFVSGLILLIERPFKAGDWIVAGPVSGTVKKISVRATEIETFQRQTIILPNSELINSAVGNWTHKNKLGRVEIVVGVAYGSNIKRVHNILLQIASEHPLVLKNPEPFVLFAGFGESSLDFEIRVYLADILNQLQVQNDIRFAIVEAFEAENIEIPFPQRDIHLRSAAIPVPAEAAEEELDTEDELRSDGKPARRRRRKIDPE